MGAGEPSSIPVLPRDPAGVLHARTAADEPDATGPTRLRDAVLAAYNTLGPRELLGMLLDQVDHPNGAHATAGASGTTALDNQPRPRNATANGDGVAHASPGLDGTRALDLTASLNPIRPGAAMANGSGLPSSPSPSDVSATSGPARSIGVPAGAVPETTVTDLHAGAARHTLMEAKNRAMLSREINVIVLDGHRKYDAWKQDLQLKLNEWGLMAFLEGTATLDVDRAAADPDYEFLFGERKTKSFSALALSLSIKLREEFKGPIETQDPAALYSALKAHFERGKENPIYLKREFYSRMLGKHEPVQQYIDGLRTIRRRIAESGDAITDNELARTILSNCVDVYPTVAIKHTEWAKGNTAVKLDVQEAVIQLETAEQAQREVRRSSGVSKANGQGLQEQRKVASMTSQSAAADKRRGTRGKPSKQTKKPRLQPGPDNRCVNCNSAEHWYCNCPKELTPKLQSKKEAWLARKNKQAAKGPASMPPSIVNMIVQNGISAEPHGRDVEPDLVSIRRAQDPVGVNDRTRRT